MYKILYMTRFEILFNRLLIYKNFKIFLIILYSVFGILIYFNWYYLSDLWFKQLTNINNGLKESHSIIITMYYCYLTFYTFIFILFPLLIFDKKHSDDYKVKISLPELNKVNAFKSIGYKLFFIGFPILAFFGVLAWLLFEITVTRIVYVLSILNLTFIAIFITYLAVSNIYKIIKKNYKIHNK